MMGRRKKIMTALTWIFFGAVVICALIIAAMRLGIVEGYDFGAGAYYYADIPGFEKLIRDEAYQTSVPMWVHIALFMFWGYLMYRFWTWVDRK